jgi:HAD superfamily hydrolase (TIGR01509 family)
MSDKILVSDDGPVCIITINRPEGRNALDLEAAAALGQAFDAFEAGGQPPGQLPRHAENVLLFLLLLIGGRKQSRLLTPVPESQGGLVSIEKILAIIFDCDGVLVDSERLANAVLVEYVREFGLVLSLEEALAQFTGGKMADCVAELEQQLGHRLPDHFVSTFRERSAAAFRTHLRPIEGVAAIVKNLHQRGLPYCVASSGPREKIELNLEITGLLDSFRERIFSAYEVGKWKPDPGLFLHAAQALGIEPQHCAVIEDSQPGIQAGLAAGMMVFAYQPQAAQSLVQDKPAIQSRSGVHTVTRMAELQMMLDQCLPISPHVSRDRIAMS